MKDLQREMKKQVDLGNHASGPNDPLHTSGQGEGQIFLILLDHEASKSFKEMIDEYCTRPTWHPEQV